MWSKIGPENVHITTDYSKEWNDTWAKSKNSATQPRHYKHGDTYEVIKVLEAWEIDKCFYLGNVIKYVARSGKKDPAKEVEDLEKAKVYLEMKIKKLKP